MAEIFTLNNRPPAINMVIKVFFALSANIAIDKIDTFRKYTNASEPYTINEH